MKTTGTYGDGFFSNYIASLLSKQSAFTIEFNYKIGEFTPNNWIFVLEDTNSNRIGLLTSGSDNGIVYARVGDGDTHGQQAFNTSDDRKYPNNNHDPSAGHHLTATEGDWNHVGFTFDSGIVKLYIDGLEIEGGAIKGSYPETTGNLKGDQFLLAWTTEAIVDNLRITKGTALTPNPDSQISTNFDAYFDFNLNEKSSGSRRNAEILNTGSDKSISGYISNSGKSVIIKEKSISKT